MCKAWEDQKKEGIKTGRREGRLELLFDLVKEGTLDISDAAKRVAMSVTEFERQMKNYPKRIKKSYV